ncbi:MAG: YeeE/YedE family protein [Rhodospirillaceae bacterium]|nr:YeeE/YedE family protein [Rhodospirillaceae bacterium]
MAALLAALGAGLLFGAGLAVSQMVSPAKVLAFLDLGAIPQGDWDPSLALVMAAALAVAAAGFRLAAVRARPLCAPAFHVPARRKIDARLGAGALLFGAGWGLVGYCPGPAIASLAYGRQETAVFVLAMLAGMLLHRLLFERGAAPVGDPASTPSRAG